MPGAKQISVANRLLGALPRKDYRKLLSVLEPVNLELGEILYESHAEIQHVYFPIDCFVSMLTTVDAGHAAEVGLIGSEGMIGVPTALGAAVSPFRAIVQGAGTAMRLQTLDFRRNFTESAALKKEVFLFTHLLMIQIAQTAACNRFHVVTQRMARWMLMTRDRVNSNEFRITQESHRLPPRHHHHSRPCRPRGSSLWVLQNCQRRLYPSIRSEANFPTGVAQATQRLISGQARISRLSAVRT